MYYCTTGQTTRATTASISSSFFSLLTVVFAIVVVTPVTAQSSSNDNDDYVATTLSNVAYDNIFGWEAASDLVAWEKLNVEKCKFPRTNNCCLDTLLGIVVCRKELVRSTGSVSSNCFHSFVDCLILGWLFFSFFNYYWISRV